MEKKWMTFALLVAAGSANAQAYLECGSTACSPTVDPWNYAVAGATGTDAISGINNLDVGGDLFDVNFTTTAPASSPFVFSSSTAPAGQPMTGVDAGAAISAFFGSIAYPSSGYGGLNYVGDLGSAYITAFSPAGAQSSKYFGATELFDVAETHVGVVDSSVPAGTVLPSNVANFDSEVLQMGEVQGKNFFTSTGQGVPTDNGGIYYTTWTPVAAPELDTCGLVGGLSLLIGALAVLRGKRAIP